MERSRLELVKKLKTRSPASQATGAQPAAGTSVGEAQEEPLFGTEL